MDEKKIISELHRMKYLFSHERGVVISEQTKIPQQLPDSSKKLSNKTVTSQETTSTKKEGSETVISKTRTEKIKLSERFTATYDEESDDPSQFLNTAYQKIIDRLNQENPEKLSILITRANIIGTASNQWGGPTKYDSDNNYKYLGGEQPQTPTEFTLDGRTITFNKNYKLNKNLANKRANKFWTKLLVKLQTPPVNPPEKPIIKMGADVTPTISQMVVNTGGQNDDVRVQQKYPNPGQTVLIDLEFVYEKTKTEIERLPVNIAETSIRTSTHWCDGTDGTGFVGNLDAKIYCLGKRDKSADKMNGAFNTSLGTKTSPRIKRIPVGVSNPKSVKGIGISDVDWTTSQVTTIMEYPKMVSTEHDYIFRYEMDYGIWEFFWQDFKITRISRTPKKGLDWIASKVKDVKGVSPGAIANILSDTNSKFYLQELLVCMNLKKGGEDAYRKSFDYYVKPYIQ